MLQYSKLQIGCLVILLYVAFVYCKECKRTKNKYKHRIFDLMLGVTTFTLILDAITAYTVNHLEVIPPIVNTVLHMLFFIGIDGFIFSVYLFLLEATEGLPKDKKSRARLCMPFFGNVIVVIATMPSLEYVQHPLTNYSMGWPAYACYAMAMLYWGMALRAFIRRRNYIERHKRAAIYVYLGALGGVTVFQMLVPSSLVTSIAYTIIIIGMYINQQNPALKELADYHREMVMGFATLVEQRDDNTGGHVRRTSMYVELLATELRNRGYYTDILTKDYIQNLTLAAPMHDIGKIAIPDRILQKPARLTPEEYEVMKLHAEKGGQIILETFGKLDSDAYMDMAYKVASFHHERWDGSGYPSGMKGQDIPLCARIMAIADVFDALSEKRCYRDAIPLDECFELIEKSKGTSFDPLLVDIFLEIREKVEATHNRV